MKKIRDKGSESPPPLDFLRYFSQRDRELCTSCLLSNSGLFGRGNGVLIQAHLDGGHI
jgi:hypothetical protein